MLLIIFFAVGACLAIDLSRYDLKNLTRPDLGVTHFTFNFRKAVYFSDDTKLCQGVKDCVTLQYSTSNTCYCFGSYKTEIAT
ncbi:MAG: hypothetical protein EZS28_045910, partial [Streblomastix strix]